TDVPLAGYRGDSVGIAMESERSRAQTLGGAKFVLIIQVSVIGITILFIWLIARCHRNWARWVFVILAVLGLPSYASTLGQMLRSKPIAGIVSIAQLTTEVLAFF